MYKWVSVHVNLMQRGNYNHVIEKHSIQGGGGGEGGEEIVYTPSHPIIWKKEKSFSSLVGLAQA